MSDDTQRVTECIRCDKTIAVPLRADRGEGRPLHYREETGSVHICDACFEVAEERDVRIEEN